MYPLLLSTRSTMTGSCLPTCSKTNINTYHLKSGMLVCGKLRHGTGRTLISFVIDRIRLRESSDSKIIPSMLLYSRRWTYAPISAIDFTCNRRHSAVRRSQKDVGQEETITNAYLHHHHIIHFWILVLVHAAILMLRCHDGESVECWS